MNSSTIEKLEQVVLITRTELLLSDSAHHTESYSQIYDLCMGVLTEMKNEQAEKLKNEFLLIDNPIFEEYKGIYKEMPIISSSFGRTRFGFDVLDKNNLRKVFFTIFESDEFEYGSAEYDYYVNRIDDEGEMPKIHVWETRQLALYQNEKSEFVETNRYTESVEFYRGEKIFHPSKRYDEMFEKMLNETLGSLAPFILMQFFDVLEEG